MERLSGNKKQRAEKKAKDVLEQGDNRLKLVAGLLVCASLTFVMWSISDAAEMMLWHVLEDVAFCSLIANAFLCLLLLFTVAPVYFGLFFVAARMLRNEKTEIIEIFDYFSSPRAYGRALTLAVNVFVRILPVVLVLRAPYIFGMLSFSIELPEYLYGAGVTLISVLLSAILVLPVSSSFGFVSFAELYPDISVRQAAKLAKRARKKNYSQVFALSYSTLLKLLLSLLTVGVVTLIHTVPMSLLRYASFAYELDNNEPKGMI